MMKVKQNKKGEDLLKHFLKDWKEKKED